MSAHCLRSLRWLKVSFVFYSKARFKLFFRLTNQNKTPQFVLYTESGWLFIGEKSARRSYECFLTKCFRGLIRLILVHFQTWDATFRRFSDQLRTKSKSWCSPPPCRRTSVPSARSSCRMYELKQPNFVSFRAAELRQASPPPFLPCKRPKLTHGSCSCFSRKSRLFSCWLILLSKEKESLTPKFFRPAPFLVRTTRCRNQTEKSQIGLLLSRSQIT